MASLIPTEWLQLAASIGFLVIGTRLIWPLLRSDRADAEQD